MRALIFKKEYFGFSLKKRNKKRPRKKNYMASFASGLIGV